MTTGTSGESCWIAAFEGFTWSLRPCTSTELPLLLCCWSPGHTVLSKCRSVDFIFLNEGKPSEMNTRRPMQGCHASALWTHKILTLWCQRRYRQVVPGITPAAMSDRQFALCQQVLWQKCEMHIFFLAGIWDFFFLPILSQWMAYKCLFCLQITQCL